MRSDLLRVHRSLHTWVGVLAGMALFIAFFAGALTMFERQVARWLTPPGGGVVALAPEDVDRLLPELYAGHPAATAGTLLKLSPDGSTITSITWSQPALEGEDAAPWRAMVDGQGALVAEPAPRSDFADFIDVLHQTAGIPGMVGHEPAGVLFMGVVSVLYVLALISGLVVLLPTLARDFMAMRHDASNKRFWLDAHNAIGVVSLPFHLVIALTAIVFAFHDPIYGAMQKSIYGDRPLFERPATHPLPEQGTDNLLPVASLLERIGEEAPGFQVAELELLNVATPRAMLRVAGTGPGGELLRGPDYGYLILQPYTGAPIYTAMVPGQPGTWLAPVTTFFALHFGNFGGNFMRWIYFFMGLAGAFVFYSGNLIWVESRRKRQRRNGGPVEQKRSARVLAALTVGVCLGSVAGVGLSLVSAKWLWGSVDHLDAWHAGIYYTVFLACVAWALTVGAPRAGRQLLLLCAGVALLIPLTSLVAAVFPGLPAWVRYDSTLGVEVVAGLSAAGCFWLARRAGRRSKEGFADSVWSQG